MTYSTIAWEAADGVGTLTFDRPDRLNGITNQMARELHEALHQIAADDSVAVVVVTGAGKAFCPGADLLHYSSGAADEPLRPETFDVPVLLHDMPQVTIAAINGACAGAGLGYACACDLRYAARSARLNTAFLDVAVAGDMGLPWTLPRIVGSGRARELSLLPRKLTADEAAGLGLVNGTFDDGDLMSEVRARAVRIAASAPLARRALKSHYVESERMGFAEFVRLETERHLRISSSADCREAFAAYVQKRQPTFHGR
jgi:2-(1,2-epoxy-1,2-dihydrophenyl)acetyl-CoA isomerase